MATPGSAVPAPAPAAAKADLAKRFVALLIDAIPAILIGVIFGLIPFIGGPIGVIEGLTVESVARSTSGARARVRVVQLTEAGERIVLTETRSGAAVTGAARVTAVRVMPPSEAYPLSTGTASLGNLLITVKSSLAADALRALLERLGEVR